MSCIARDTEKFAVRAIDFLKNKLITFDALNNLRAFFFYIYYYYIQVLNDR